MGKIFSDETTSSLDRIEETGLSNPHPRFDLPPSSRLSPAVFKPPRSNHAEQRTSDAMQDILDTDHVQATKLSADATLERQVGSEMAQVQRLRIEEHNDMVELVSPYPYLTCADIRCPSTLASMFPGLDKELIDDVVRIKQGRWEAYSYTRFSKLTHGTSSRVQLAVDACLALSS